METAAASCPCRLLDEDELPNPGELELGTARYVQYASCSQGTISFPVPLVHQVLESRKKGLLPCPIAIDDIDAEATSALAVAQGVNLPYPLCVAASLFVRYGPEALTGSPYLQVMLAYQAFTTSLLSHGSSDEEAISESLRFWTEVIHDPREMFELAATWTDSLHYWAFGVSSVDPLGGVCRVIADGYAFAIGFEYADTVVLAQTKDNGDNLVVRIGTIADDTSFMNDLLAMLNDAERELDKHVGVPGKDIEWRLRGNDLLVEPEGGSRLTLDEITDLAIEAAPSSNNGGHNPPTPEG